MQNILNADIWNAHFCGYLQDFQSSIATSFHILHVNARKMWNASYGLILSLPIVHYFQIEQTMAECDGNDLKI